MTTISFKRHLTAAALTFAGWAAFAQSYPVKPITLVVPNPPGGFVDTSARILSDSLAKVTGQSIVVDNKGGGSGNVAYQFAARANADGYTLLNSYSAYHVGNPNLTPKLPWAQKDFVSVALITVATNVIAIHPSVPANSLQDFIGYVKTNPGKLSYASQGTGSLSHIGTEMFKQQTKSSMVHIPYRGSGPALQDVLSGQVQVFMTTPPSVMSHVQASKLKGLAVTSKTRHPSMPNVPAVSEMIKGYEFPSEVGILAPAGLPPAVLNKLAAAIKAACDSPDFAAKFKDTSTIVTYKSPAEYTENLKTNLQKYSDAAKLSKITPD